MDFPSSESGSNLSSQTSVQSSSQVSASPVQPTGNFGQNTLPGQQNQTLPRPGLPTPPSHLSSLNQPNPPNVTITNKAPQPSQIAGQHPDGTCPTRGHSPVTIVLRNCILCTSGVLHPGGPNMGLRVAAASQGPPATANTTIAGVNGSNSIAVQLSKCPPFAQQNPQSQSSQQQSTSIASSLPVQSKLVNVTSGSQMISQPVPAMTTASSGMQPQTVPGGMASMTMASGCNQQNAAQQQQMGAMSVPPGVVKKRCSIWQGVIEFQEVLPTSTCSQPSRVSHSLACSFTGWMTNGEADVNAEKWPNRLMLQLIPRHVILSGNLFPVLLTGARDVLIYFSPESEGLQKLSKTMDIDWVGCIQFQAPCDLRIMVVLYFPYKRLYRGLIPNDQETFFNNIRQVHETFFNASRQVHETFCKQQQQKQQRMQQIAGNSISTSETMSTSSSSSSNANMLMTQSNSGNIGSSNSQLASCLPLGQQQVGQNPSQQPQPPSSSSTMVPAINQQQQSLSQQQSTSARLSQLEVARQQNLAVQHKEEEDSSIPEPQLSEQAYQQHTASTSGHQSHSILEPLDIVEAAMDDANEIQDEPSQIPEVQNKWKNLRSSYVRKKRKGKTGTKGGKKKKWALLDALYRKGRSTYSNTVPTCARDGQEIIEVDNSVDLDFGTDSCGSEYVCHIGN